MSHIHIITVALSDVKSDMTELMYVVSLRIIDIRRGASFFPAIRQLYVVSLRIMDIRRGARSLTWASSRAGIGQLTCNVATSGHIPISWS